jgi:EF-hand domain pair
VREGTAFQEEEIRVFNTHFSLSLSPHAPRFFEVVPTPTRKAKSTASMAAARRQFQAARQEFKDLSISELKEYEQLFSKHDDNGDGFLDLQELKYLMEKIGKPQTHLALKAMIREVDEDQDDKIAYREFLLIFRYAKTGRLCSEGLRAIASSVCVDEVGVGGARGMCPVFLEPVNSLRFSLELVNSLRFSFSQLRVYIPFSVCLSLSLSLELS